MAGVSGLAKLSKARGVGSNRPTMAVGRKGT